MGAKKQLLMYEMKIDVPFVRMLTDKVSEGVDVRIIGTTPAKGNALPIRKRAAACARHHARWGVRVPG